MKRQALIAPLAAAVVLAGCGGSPTAPELSAPDAARMDGGGLGSGYAVNGDGTSGTHVAAPPDSTGRGGGLGSGY
jgi:hypothetical protein